MPERHDVVDGQSAVADVHAFDEQLDDGAAVLEGAMCKAALDRLAERGDVLTHGALLEQSA
ncbi:MAG: hypothetical protein QME96_16680, partial [Myxococcota bacterium]|nr:hypothetical protein [Myxococcota bacterium]